jgi:hypothetical protein
VLATAQPPGLSELRALAPTSPGIVFTQLRQGSEPRLALLDWSGNVRPLVPGFHASADPDVSFDARRLVFAGRRTLQDHWQIFEMALPGGAPRAITSAPQDCRQPIYQSRVFSLDIPEPWYQVAYVSNGSLHSIKLDGTLHQQLTFTPSRDADPLILPDGRMIYSSTIAGRSQLMGVNLDGTDYALFLPGSALRSPAVLGDSTAVFVEGQGTLATVNLERPLHTRRPIPGGPGLYSTPSALPNGELLVSWRPTPAGPSSLYRLHPTTGRRTLLLTGGITQAKFIAPRIEPAGRGSVVDEAVNSAKLYCLSVFTTDAPSLVNPRQARRVRLLTGPAAKPRQLGEADLEQDGSFHLEMAPNQPLKVQILSLSGTVLRTSGWFFVRNKEQRGCIGCHEDPELAPENREAQAVIKKAVRLVHSTPGGAK